ncbi:IMS-domain-containing protein [Rickenella mellea]|uniref:DNA polymerase kappa n=1 Tax=Rickenella mellea TaxID=50990 RepID=A0A4Y7QFD9_9AGAM|nr:IMS-domain-containing protein [Rickenella mellea]
MANNGLGPNPSPDSTSLVKRLAGPSVTKAGLATDQTEINRIIAEASKGSKFYENEKRKDKELTERISKILAIRDEAVKNADIQKVEADVDRQLVELESQRDLSQYIVHVDMDAFFANVELMENPDLAGKPFGVGRGVLTTASYEARKYGVRSGMAGFVAKKLCPDLILVPINHKKYWDMSGKVMEIFQRYDPEMLVAGCDEGYLNITQYCEEHNISAEDCVQELRAKVYEETKLTVSAGIAPNKNKPNGQYQLPFESQAITAFMRDLPIRKLFGVGKVNERVLDSIGLKTCGDIYEHRAVIFLLDKYLGLHFLLNAYLGLGSNIVRPHQRDERKSIGAERTFAPIHDRQKILDKLEEVATELESDMEENGWAGKTVTLKFKLHTYQVFTRAKSFDRWITKRDDLYRTGFELIKDEFPLKLRLIGLRVTKLKDLRCPDDQGIKRFFGGAGQSPTKAKRGEATESDHEDLTAVDEENMPGFLEHQQWEDELNRDVRSPSVAPKQTKEVLVCPMCSKELETDNAGLNEHIDFCLSKKAIMQATTPVHRDSASSPTQRKRKRN